MPLSIFNSTINIDENYGSVILYCKFDEDKLEQHAIMLIESLVNSQHSVFSYDFYPNGPVDPNFYGNASRRLTDQVRPGIVRERSMNLAGITKSQFFQMLHIDEGIFFQNYIQQSREINDINSLIQQCRHDKDFPPCFVYSGKPDLAGVPVRIFNCITWIKNIFSEAQVPEIEVSLLMRLARNTTGLCVESCFDQNIPVVHTTDYSKCTLM